MVKATSAVSSLVALQLVSRVSTFALSTALARSLGARFYGLANVQLQLINSSVLFLSKEGLRRACQRTYAGGGGPALAHGMNLAWLSVPLSMLFAIACGWYAVSRGGSKDLEQLVSEAEYADTVVAVSAAAALEAVADPGWLYAQANDLIGRRVLAEGAALVLKAAATAWLALRLGAGARSFGWGALVYAGSYVALLYALLGRECALRTLAPRAAPEAAKDSSRTVDAAQTDGRAPRAAVAVAVWWPRRQRVVAAQYCWQSVQKYALTEGERVVLVWLSPLAQQGEYALVANLGSLVARLLLAPLEEVAFAHFSQLAAVATPLPWDAIEQLHALLRAAATFGALFVVFGPAYSWLLLRLLYGSRWSEGDAPSLLGLYCGYVGLMALNGLAEAFVNATASRAQLNALASAMVLLSLLYLPAAAVGLHTAGAAGLVLANGLSMVVRIGYACTVVGAATRDARAAHAHERASAPPLPSMLPRRPVLLALVASAATTWGGRHWLGMPRSPPAHHACHVALGLLCLAAVGLAVVRAEPELVPALRAARRKQS